MHQLIHDALIHQPGLIHQSGLIHQPGLIHGSALIHHLWTVCNLTALISQNRNIPKTKLSFFVLAFFCVSVSAFPSNIHMDSQYQRDAASWTSVLLILMLLLSETVQPEANVHKSAGRPLRPSLKPLLLVFPGVTVLCSEMKVSDLRAALLAATKAGIVPLKATQSSTLVVLMQRWEVGM